MAGKVTATAEFQCRSLGRMYGEYTEFTKGTALSGVDMTDIAAQAVAMGKTICGGYRLAKITLNQNLAMPAPRPAATSGVSSYFKDFWDVMDRCLANHRKDCDLR